MTLEPEARALVDRMHGPRGYLHEWHLYLAQRAPDVLDLWERLTRAQNATSELPPRYRECVYVGVLSSRGEHEVAKNHMHKALDHGATERELLDAVLAAFNPTGALTMVHGIGALVEVLEERGLYVRPEVPYRVTDRPTDAGRRYGDDPEPSGERAGEQPPA